MHSSKGSCFLNTFKKSLAAINVNYNSVYTIFYAIFCWLIQIYYCFLNTQGVTRVRNRVTLMVVSVSVIFGMCWTPMQVSYFLMRYTSYQNNPVQVAITNTLVLFNSAVNPFVYALLNQQFREKIKKMICCAGPISPRIQALEEPQEIELSNGNNHSSVHRPIRPAQKDHVPRNEVTIFV